MLYQHTEHAGNRADIIKHSCLVEALRSGHYTTVWDAFAASPVYPLGALNTGHIVRLRALCEISQIQNTDVLCRIIGSSGNNLIDGMVGYYPSSGVVIKQLSNPHKLILSDNNAECVDSLKQYYQQQTDVSVLLMDSYRSVAEVMSFLPQLVLIDPPYMDTDEWHRVESLVNKILSVGGDTRVLVWYPLREDICINTGGLEAKSIITLEAVFDGSRNRLKGCGVVFINFAESQLASLPELAAGLETIPALELVGVSLRGF